MQKPEHITQVALRPQQTTRKRVVSVAIVGGLHLFVLWALASGLAGKVTGHLIQDVKVAVVKETPPDVKPPPPPPPDFKIPPPDFVPPPEINISMDAPANAISQVQNKVAPVAPPPPRTTQVTPPRAAGRGHECESQYPPLSRRLSEQGVVRVRFTVTAEGSVSGPTVVKSSGYQRLDDAAIQCTGRWRYHPAQRDGQPVAVATEANIRYQLR